MTIKRRRIPQWQAEFELLEAQSIFDDFDQLAQEEKLAEEKRERYRLKRERNLRKALRIRPRLYRVQNLDPWAETSHIPAEDDWGDRRPRYEAVKAFHARKDRLLWVLTSLYNYWSFDYVQGQSFKPNKRTLTFSFLADKYDTILDELRERVRQENWDRKRARVKSRREKREQGKVAKPFNTGLKSRLSEMLTLRFGASGPDIVYAPRVSDVPSEALAQELRLRQEQEDASLSHM
jgi:hypothetical protein